MTIRLNSHGRRRLLGRQTSAYLTLAAAVTALVGFALLPGASVAAPTQTKPTNTSLPTISGSPVKGNVLHGGPGAWTGDQPITFRYRWLRCSPVGDNCSEIARATDNDYLVRQRDIGKTLRVRVTAGNDAGSMSAVSAATDVAQPAPPSGRITLPSGEVSVAASSVPSNERLVVSQVVFSPNPVSSRESPITARIRVKDTRGFVVRDALVFIRSTPRVTSGGRGESTASDGWVTYQLQPNANFPVRTGYHVQFFVKAYRSGDPVLAGVAGYRLVQVATATS